jgi:hypothetical protein
VFGCYYSHELSGCAFLAHRSYFFLGEFRQMLALTFYSSGLRFHSRTPWQHCPVRERVRNILGPRSPPEVIGAFVVSSPVTMEHFMAILSRAVECLANQRMHLCFSDLILAAQINLRIPNRETRRKHDPLLVPDHASSVGDNPIEAPYAPL